MSKCAAVALVCWIAASFALGESQEARSPLEDDFEPVKKYPASFIWTFPSCMGSAVRLARAYTVEGIIMKDAQKAILKRETNPNYFASDADIELKR